VPPIQLQTLCPVAFGKLAGVLLRENLRSIARLSRCVHTRIFYPDLLQVNLRISILVGTSI